MNQELDGRRQAREQLSEEQLAESRAKKVSYALVNRPSPPY